MSKRRKDPAELHGPGIHYKPTPGKADGAPRDFRQLNVLSPRPFARTGGENLPKSQVSEVLFEILRCLYAGLHTYFTYCLNCAHLDRLLPGDFIDEDGELTSDEDSPFVVLMADLEPHPSGFLKARAGAENLGLERTGVHRSDRCLANILALQLAIQDAIDWEYEPIQWVDDGWVEGPALNVLCPSKGGESKDRIREMWYTERPGRDHDAIEDGPRALTLWGRAVMLHQRLRDRCERVLAIAGGNINLHETRWLASMHTPPCAWDGGEVRRLGALAEELRQHSSVIQPLCPGQLPRVDLEALPDALRDLVEALDPSAGKTAKDLSIELYGTPVRTNSIFQNVSRLRDEGVPVEHKPGLGYRLGPVRLI